MTAILSENELDHLEDYLFSDCVSESAFDYNGCHGVIIAAIISPETITIEQCLEIIVDSTPNFNQKFSKESIITLLNKLYHGLSTQLSNEISPMLPCQMKYLDEGLINWCAGFLEIYHLNEELWHSSANMILEDDFANLLLPFILCSHTIEDDEELKQIAKNQDLAQDMAEQIPELVTDLYLHFKAPTEK